MLGKILVSILSATASGDMLFCGEIGSESGSKLRDALEIADSGVKGVYEPYWHDWALPERQHGTIHYTVRSREMY